MVTIFVILLKFLKRLFYYLQFYEINFFVLHHLPDLDMYVKPARVWNGWVQDEKKRAVKSWQIFVLTKHFVLFSNYICSSIVVAPRDFFLHTRNKKSTKRLDKRRTGRPASLTSTFIHKPFFLKSFPCIIKIPNSLSPPLVVYIIVGKTFVYPFSIILTFKNDRKISIKQRIEKSLFLSSSL